MGPIQFMRCLACSVAVALASVLSSARVEAQVPAPASPERSSSYLGTMMLTDVAVIGVTSAVLAASVTGAGNGLVVAAAGAVGLIAFVGTGAVVHASHGNHRQVWRSLTRRSLLPLGAGLGAGLVANSRGCSGEDCDLGTAGYAAIGVGAGMLVAVAWDWSVAHLDSRFATALVPFSATDRERVVFGLVGRF